MLTLVWRKRADCIDLSNVGRDVPSYLPPQYDVMAFVFRTSGNVHNRTRRKGLLFWNVSCKAPISVSPDEKNYLDQPASRKTHKKLKIFSSTMINNVIPERIQLPLHYTSFAIKFSIKLCWIFFLTHYIAA